MGKALTVEDYIARHNDDVQGMLTSLRAQIFATLPNVTEKMKYGAPVYWNSAGQEVAYLYGGKDHAHLGFQNGVDLNDPDHVLEGRGESGRHVKVSLGSHVPEQVMRALLQQVA